MASELPHQSDQLFVAAAAHFIRRHDKLQSRNLDIDGHWEVPCVGSDGVIRFVHIISEGNKVPGHIVYSTDPASISNDAGTSKEDDRDTKILAEIAAAAAMQRSLRA